MVKLGRLLCLVAIFGVFLGTLILPAFSTVVSIPAFKIESYNGVNPATGGTYYNGTISGAGANDRNFTAFFNVTNYVGNYFSNFGVRHSYSVGWASSGNNTANCIYAIVEPASVSNRQANPSASTYNTNSTDNVRQMIGTGYQSNNSAFNFTDAVYLSENFLIVTVLANTSCNAVAVNELNPNLDYSTLFIDDSYITTNTSSPSATERWRSLDFVDTSTPSSSALVSKIENLRNDGRDFDVVSSDGFSRSVKSSTASALYYGSFLNSSSDNFVFTQYNDTFSVYPVNLTSEVFFSGSGYNRIYSYQGMTTVAGTKYPFYGMYSEVQTASSFPTLQPITCFIEFESDLSNSANVRAKTICGSPNGLSTGSERAYLRDSTNTTLATVFTGSDTTTETTLTNGGSYNILFGLPTTGNKTISFTLPTVGASKIVLYQYLNGTLFESFDAQVGTSNLLFGDSSASFYFAGRNATTGATISNEGKTQKYSLISTQTSAYRTHFGSVPGLAYTSVTFSSPTGQTFQRGVFHAIIPESSASVSYSCPSSVTVQAGVAWTITCTDLSIQATQSQYITGYSSGTSSSLVYGVLNNKYYRALVTDAGLINRLVIQDLNGNLISSSLRTTSFDILKQTAATNTTKFYKLTFYDVTGAAYTAYSQITFLIGNPVGTQSNGHHAVFVSFISNATGVYSLPYVSVNASGGTCVTREASILVSNGTSLESTTVSKCDIYVPNSLDGLALSFNHSGNLTSLNNTFWGYYNDSSASSLGVNASDYGSVYYYVWDENVGREFVSLDLGTCNEPEVNRQTNNSNERCAVVSCPVSRTIDTVETRRINPNTFTCSSPGSQKCFIDGSLAYKVVCGNICQVEAELCPTSSCNADSSGCAGEATGTETSTDRAIRSNPYLNFALGTHSVFFVGIFVSLLLAIGAYGTLKDNPELRGKFAVGVFMFCFIGSAILAGEWFALGLIVLVLIAFATIFLIRTYGGITGVK